MARCKHPAAAGAGTASLNYIGEAHDTVLDGFADLVELAAKVLGSAKPGESPDTDGSFESFSYNSVTV